MKFELVPMTLPEANAFVEMHHRHLGPVQGHKFSIGIAVNEKVVGVAIVGRPVTIALDNGWTLEVRRLCSDGTPNVCSALYRAAWRATQALGYKRLVTYCLKEETGASLRGAGFRFVGVAGGGTWNRKLRPRVDKHPLGQKTFWEIKNND